MSNDNEIKSWQWRNEYNGYLEGKLRGHEVSPLFFNEDNKTLTGDQVCEIIEEREADRARIAELEAKVQELSRIHESEIKELENETFELDELFQQINELQQENQELKTKLERLKSQILILEHVEGMAKIWIDYYALECGTPEEIEMQQLFDEAEFELNMHFYGHYKAGEITLNNITKALNDD